MPSLVIRSVSICLQCTRVLLPLSKLHSKQCPCSPTSWRTKMERNVNKDRSEKDKSDKEKCDKEDKPEKHNKRGKCFSTASSREKRPAEKPKATTSAVAREQNNAGVDQGEKALLEIVMAGFETLNKTIVSLRKQDEPTCEEYQLDDLPDDELADPGELGRCG